ncbi:hypothetical protein [Halolamina salifodinae]|uniref:Uncharacterized protein n=1 Tax=Halolamina salifodinae TaxID=1202767 RepID=A0A8T4GYN7_9EURY|nr:hypothetical protein [Halolamina salifodinae]MBP1986485.1 hypothetical protein [Halolamina salifodinae]
MAHGNDPRRTYSYGTVSPDNRERFQDALGLSTRSPAEPTIDSLRPSDDMPAEELAERGKAIRDDLSGSLDADLIEELLAELADEIRRVPELREIGCPERGHTPYQDLITAGWELVDHLSAVGFFQSAEENLPAFTDDHIEATTEQLFRMDSLTGILSDLGLPEHEQLALVTNIVNASEQLSWWERTSDYPDISELGRDDYDDGIVQEYSPPLHHRAMEGSLLWIDGLDWHLWQKEVLITQEMIEKGVWDVKSMLAGVYLLGDTARRLADGEITDENLTTMTTASTAMMVIGQEFLVDDVAWIDDSDRAPAEAW